MTFVAQFLVIVTVGYLFTMAALSFVKRPQSTDVGSPRHYFFVFVVPALNEERVVLNTLRSLDALPSDRTMTLVVDDASDDRTAQIVEGFASDRVHLLQRHKPDAQQGKGAVLNAAYTEISRWAGDLDPDRIVVAVVDADGRLAPDALDHIEAHFDDPAVGAVQLMVRIFNRDRWITRFQDFEFVSFSTLVQRARRHLGSVGLGGNGQFVRLSALRSLGAAPWTDCLTEDLDLGVRLAMAGWENDFTANTAVEQQGLHHLGALVRQRTRWLHGHWQCWRLVGDLVRSDLPSRTVFDLCYYLAAPAILILASVLFTIPLIGLIVAIATGQWFTGMTWGAGGYIVLWYLLAFAPALLLGTAYWRLAKDESLARSLVVGHGLLIYNYVWYIAAWRALGRILLRRSGWTKTARHTEQSANTVRSTI